MSRDGAARAVPDARSLPARPERAAIGTGVVTSLATLALYAATLSPWAGHEDVAEFQTLGAAGGIAHAGYPLLTLLLRVAHALPLVTPAWRAGLVSAVAMAIAAGLLAWSAARATGSRVGAWAGALALALSASAWRDATRAEVYALSLALSAAAFLALHAWCARGGARRAFPCGLLLGLALTEHLGALALATLAAIVVLARAARGGVRAREWLAGLAGLALGLSALLVLAFEDVPGHPMNYLESAFDAFARQHVAWAPDAITHVRRVVLLLSGRQYLEGGWFHPFKDTMLRLRELSLGLVANDLPLAGTLLALAGIAVAVKHHRAEALLRLGWIAAVLGWLAYAAFDNVLGSFFLPALWALAWFVASAVAWLERRSFAAGLAALALVIACPFARLALHAPPAMLAGHPVLDAVWREWPGENGPAHGDPSWEEYAHGALTSLPHGAIVVSRWDEGTALLYQRLARNVRTDVTVRLTGDQPRRIEHARADAARAGGALFASFPPGSPDSSAWTPAGRWARGGLWRFVGAH